MAPSSAQTKARVETSTLKGFPSAKFGMMKSMKRPLIVQYSPDGSFFFFDLDETGNRRGPAFGPFSREKALFELAAAYGFTDYDMACELLERVEGDHSAKSL